MDLLIHVANALRLFSSLEHDMVRMRLLTVIGASCLALYFGTRAEPMLTVIGWNLFFIAVNLVQVGRLLAQRGKSREGNSGSAAPEHAH